MMYTSQEGELYVSQARALGAVGVLPKTVRPVDVSRILYQLHLLPERRTAALGAVRARGGGAMSASRLAAGHGRCAATAICYGVRRSLRVDDRHTGRVPAVPLRRLRPACVHAAPCAELQAGLRQSIQQLVKDQLGEQRRFMLATFEAFARRMTSEIKESIARMPPPPAIEPSLTPPPQRRQWWPVVLTALLGGCCPLRCSAALALQTPMRQPVAVRANWPRREAATWSAPGRPRSAAAPPLPARTAGGRCRRRRGGEPPSGPLATEYVPYGETPLSHGRLERLRALAATLEAQQFKGRIRVESFVGDFCLTGNASDGFSRRRRRTCRRRSATWSATRSTTRCRRRSTSRSTSRTSLRRCASAPAAPSVVDAVDAGRTQPVAYPEQDEKTHRRRVEHHRGAEQPRRVPRPAGRMTGRDVCSVRRQRLHGRTDRARGRAPRTAARARRTQSRAIAGWPRNSAASIASHRARRRHGR